MTEIIYLSAVAFVGGFVQGFTGFGVVLVALPLMVFAIDIKTAIPLMLLLGMMINLILLVQLARHAQIDKWLPLLLGSLPGMPVGLYVLKTIGPRPLELLVGSVILLTVGVSFFTRPLAKEHNRIWAYVAGFGAGFLGGSIGAAGPPVVIYTALQPWTKQQIKATLVVFFFLSGIGIIGMHLFSGLVTRTTWYYWGYCLPSLVLGVFTGIRLYNQSNDTIYRRAVLGLLAVLGVLLLIKD